MSMLSSREFYFIHKSRALREALEIATSETKRNKLIHDFQKVMKEKDFAKYVCQSATELPFDLLPLEIVNKFFSSKELRQELININDNHLYSVVMNATKDETRKINCTLFNDKFFNNKKFPYFYSNLMPECQKEYIKYAEKPKTIMSMLTTETLIANYKAPEKEDKKFLKHLIEVNKQFGYLDLSYDTKKAIIKEFGYGFAKEQHLAEVFNFLGHNANKDPEFSLKLLDHPEAQQEIALNGYLDNLYWTCKTPDVFQKLVEVRFNQLDKKENKTFDVLAERFFLDHPENILIEYNTIKNYANDCPDFKEKHQEEMNELANFFDDVQSKKPKSSAYENFDRYYNADKYYKDYVLKTYNMQAAYSYFLELEKQHKLNPLLKLKYEIKYLFNQELKNNLIDLNNPQTFDDSFEYDGVKIHKLDGKSFNMMVHTTGRYQDGTENMAKFAKNITTFNKKDSYVMSMSLISEKNLGLCGKPERTLIFGYSSSINPNKIEGACVVDNLSGNISELNGKRIASRANTYLSLETFKKGTHTYNELNYAVIEPKYDYERLVDKVYIKPSKNPTFAEEITEAIKSKNFTKLETSAECIAEKITKTAEAESTIFLSQNPETQKQMEDKISGIVKNFKQTYIEKTPEQIQEETKIEEPNLAPGQEETITFKPDFLVCYDKVAPVHTGVAKALGIDIVVINTQKYNQDFERPSINYEHYK